MKNCPLCATEYYDEAKWCPDCEYDFPAGPAAAPPDTDEIWRELERVANEQETGDGAAAAMAGRIADLYREADGKTHEIWRLSPEFLKNADEYDMAKRLFDRWETLSKKNTG